MLLKHFGKAKAVSGEVFEEGDASSVRKEIRRTPQEASRGGQKSSQGDQMNLIEDFH